jgi:glycosyltransferase involved in cell wall biosynthesis
MRHEESAYAADSLTSKNPTDGASYAGVLKFPDFDTNEPSNDCKSVSDKSGLALYAPVANDELPTPISIPVQRNRSVTKWPRVSVVIPAKNEARNLPHVLARIPKDVYEVILVDGHSTDDTVEVAETHWPGIRVVHDSRRGKGNALACGFEAVRGDIIVMLDADGSADGQEIPRFVKALVSGADFAKGSRFLEGGGSCDITKVRQFGNWLLTTCVNVLFRTNYSDLCYGYNAFWTRHLPVLHVDSDGFEVETLINVRVTKAGLNVVEVPSFESNRLNGVSNLRAGRDGTRVLKTILREWANRAGWAHAKPATYPLQSLQLSDESMDEQVASGN